MTQDHFLKLADQEIERIYNKIEDLNQDGSLELDFLNGILQIEDEEGRQFLINKHSAMQELWLSSPVSGAHHFKFNGKYWQSTKDDNILFDMLIEEIKTIL